jgi:hypothetical protein
MHVKPSIPSYFNKYFDLDLAGFIRSASELVPARDPDEVTEDGNGGYAMGMLSPRNSFIRGSGEATLAAFKISETYCFFFFFFVRAKGFEESILQGPRSQQIIILLIER